MLLFPFCENPDMLVKRIVVAIRKILFIK